MGLINLFEALFGEGKPAKSLPQRQPSPRPSRAQAGRVRNTRQFYEERGWQLRGRSLHGWFRTRHGAFRGQVDNPFSASPIYSLFDPPQKLIDGPHGPCFRQKDQNRFEIHWNSKPSDVNAGILQIEHTLLEALG